MPRLNIDYSKCVIYKIECKDLSVKGVYVGQTSDFKSRKYAHKQACNDLKSHIKLYETIRANGGWDNYNMIVVEKYPCNNSIEARIQENKWYHELNADLNSNRPHTTKEETKQREQQRLREKNKEVLAEKQRIYEEHMSNIENGTALKTPIYTRNAQKAYYQRNHDEILVKRRDYKKKIAAEKQRQQWFLQLAEMVVNCMPP